MRNKSRQQLTLFREGSEPVEVEVRPRATLVSLLDVRARADAKRRARLDDQIVARAAHLLGIQGEDEDADRA